MLNLPEDTKQAAAIELRRRNEAERKLRIFNRRTLVLGVDREALDRQVAERRRHEEGQRQLDLAFERQRLQDARHGMFIDTVIKQEKRSLDREINEFRAVYQRKEHRRDYDLYDPDALKKSLPARVRDDDPRCGISSAQRFEGEDVASRERAKHLKVSAAEWLRRQMEEREAAEEEAKQAQKAYDEVMVARDSRAVQLEIMEQELKRRVDSANSRFNLALAQEAESRRLLEKSRSAEEDRAEIYNAVTGDLLTENPEVHHSAYGSNRVIGFMYKGMTDEQRMEVRRHQQLQMEEKRIEREREASRDAAFARQMATHAAYNLLGENDAAHMKRQEHKQVSQHNRRLAVQREAEKVVYSNTPTEEYFDQFNSSTR